MPADTDTERVDQGEGGMFAKLLSKQVGDSPAPQPDAPPAAPEVLEAEAAPSTEEVATSAVPVSMPLEPEVVSSPSIVEPQEVSTPLDKPAGATKPAGSTENNSQAARISGDPTVETALMPSGTNQRIDEEPREEDLRQVADPFIGKKITDRFLVRELLASGAERSTYLADDTATGRKALAQTFPADAFDRRPLKEFYADALRKLSRFRDADFASILASGRLPDGGILLVSEFVEGNSLAQVVGFVGHFETQRAAKLIRKIADALNEAHELGVFHGSLRAENVVLLHPDDPQDNIKIIGLGIAFADGEVLDGGVPTAPDDIYDLAIIAFQLLTGKNPFPGLHGSDVLRSGVGISVCTHRPELSPEVDVILSRALSVGQSKGFADIREFGDALHDALIGTEESVDDAARPRAAATVMKPAEDEPEDGEFQDLERIQVRELDRKEKTAEDSDPAIRPVDGEARGVGKRLTVLVAVAAVLAVGAAVYVGMTWRLPTKTPASPSAGSAEQVVIEDKPIVSRNLEVPNGYRLFTNSKDGLSTEMAKSFIPFTLHYPVSWTRLPSATNFADISLKEPDGSTIEHFIVTSYASAGTFALDRGSFPQLVEKSNREVGSLLGNGFKPLSQGETTIQGGRLKAYEVKFLFEGELGGRKTVLWGRRLWVPVQKEGARHGFVITLIATPKSPDVEGVEDVGNKGRLKVVLDSFEPKPE